MKKAKSDLAFLCRSLKAPSLARSFERLADQARAESWSHEEFLAACLDKEVTSRNSHGGENRIKAARFASYKTLEEFDFSFQRSARKEVISRLGTLDFIEAKQNVVFLGPPGTASRILRPLLGSGPARPVTGSCSQPLGNGWLDFKQHTIRAGCPTS